MCNSIDSHAINIIDLPLRGSMRGAYNDNDDRTGLRGYVEFNIHTYNK